MTSVVIVGAGVIGASIADALAARGADVTVLDMRSPGRGASQASAGVLAPFIEAEPDSALLALGRRSLGLFDDFVAGAAERSRLSIEYRKTGTLQVALSEDGAARLKAAGAWLIQQGVAHEWLDAAALAAREPAVTAEALGGLLISDHAIVGVVGLVKALVAGARFSGARFESPVEAVQVDPRPDGVGVRAGDRRYHADFVVVAAGSWSGRVRIAGVPSAPVKPIRGQLAQLSWAGAGLPSCAVWGPRCYTVPWRDGSLLVGATVEDAGFDERATVAGVGGLLEAVVELLPRSRGAALTEVRVGLRPASADGLPIVGPWPQAPRVVMATGHYRNGILLAPLTAAVVSRYVIDGDSDPAFEVTSPGRTTA